jgi:hypothetical protein
VSNSFVLSGELPGELYVRPDNVYKTHIPNKKSRLNDERSIYRMKDQSTNSDELAIYHFKVNIKKQHFLSLKFYCKSDEHSKYLKKYFEVCINMVI